MKQWILLPVLLCGGCLSAPAEQQTNAVASYNIKHGRGMDNRVDLQRTARVLKTPDADLVALREVDNACRRSGRIDEAAALGRLLGMHHAFGKFMDFQGGAYGMAILSKYPVDRAITHRLPDGAEPRCALEVIVRPPGAPAGVSFVCIHNDWTDEAIRVRQVRALIAALSPRKHRVIPAGDFNAPRSSASMQLLPAGGWTILEKSGGGKNTFPADKPRAEIDFIVLRGFGGRAPGCRVHAEAAAADHRPISAVITPGK